MSKVSPLLFIQQVEMKFQKLLGPQEMRPL